MLSALNLCQQPIPVLLCMLGNDISRLCRTLGNRIPLLRYHGTELLPDRLYKLGYPHPCKHLLVIQQGTVIQIKRPSALDMNTAKNIAAQNSHRQHPVPGIGSVPYV